MQQYTAIEFPRQSRSQCIGKPSRSRSPRPEGPHPHAAPMHRSTAQPRFAWNQSILTDRSRHSLVVFKVSAAKIQTPSYLHNVTSSQHLLGLRISFQILLPEQSTVGSCISNFPALLQIDCKLHILILSPTQNGCTWDLPRRSGADISLWVSRRHNNRRLQIQLRT